MTHEGNSSGCGVFSLSGVLKLGAVRVFHLDELGKGLIDEDQGDEEREDLLREGRDVADQEAALCRHNHQDDEDEPESDPHSAGQVLVIVGLTELRVKKNKKNHTDVFRQKSRKSNFPDFLRHLEVGFFEHQQRS